MAEICNSAAAAAASTRLIPDLPDEITIACIARVPRTFHPDLSLVSRSWRSLLRSPLLFTIRSDLGVSEPFLCINIHTRTGQSRWYLLDRGHCLRPDRLLPLPPPPVATYGSACTSAGPLLYVLGGFCYRDRSPSSAVQVFDARINRWTPAPPMSVGKQFATAENLNGRIYAIGGRRLETEFWAEVLDPSIGEWVPVPSPPHVREKWIHRSAVLAGRLFAAADRGGVVYDPAAPEEERWGLVPPALDFGWKRRAAVVGEVLYTFGDYWRMIMGYDWAADKWKLVEGLERELPKFRYGATPANLGGMLCMVWKGRGNSRSKEMWIEIAGIEVARTSCGDLRGSIAWSVSAALAIPRGSAVVHCLALEL